jgi:hypothetical protein
MSDSLRRRWRACSFFLLAGIFAVLTLPAFGQNSFPDKAAKAPFSQLKVKPASLSFAKINFQKGPASSTKSLLVTNGGSAALAVTVGSPATAAFSVIAGAGPATLDAGQTEPVTVEFAPAAAGSFGDAIAVSSDATKGKTEISVRLKGSAAGVNTSLPTVTLNAPAAGATHLSGHAYNVDPATTKAVIYVFTNQWYVQPFVDAPFTNISANGSWTSFTHSWDSIAILLVDPANYTPVATETTDPTLDPGVIASTEYPALNFSGRTWGIKVTGNSQFGPGPNYWSNNSSVVKTAPDGLHLKISRIDNLWRCGEVYLLQSLGYGTYTVQVSSRLDQLDQNTVAAPLFIYAAAAADQELDNEYSGAGGLIPNPYNAQFVVQPFTVPGNIVQYVQPSSAQFTSQMEWRADHVTFTSWNGWASVPASGDIINQWTYTGSDIPPPGQERVHINLWLFMATHR